jgi:hypothetical protein
VIKAKYSIRFFYGCLSLLFVHSSTHIPAQQKASIHLQPTAKSVHEKAMLFFSVQQRHL